MVRKRVGVWVVFLNSIFFNVVVRWSESSSLVWKLSSLLLFALSSDSRVQTQRPSEVLTVDTSINTSWGLTHKTWGLKSNQTNKSVGAQAAQWGSHSQTDLKQVQLVKITVCSPRGPTPVRLVQHGREHHWRASSHYFRNIWSQKRQHSQRGRLATDRWELQSVSSTSGLVSGGSDADLLFGQSVVLFVGDQPQSSLVSALWRPQQLWQRAAAHWRPASCLHPSDLYNNSQLSVFVSEVDLLLNTNLDWNILCYIH